ncbi:MAG: DUF308 domain-containing protein, partial [Candidatus Nomurabacteria bacterium]|nr:DUF308 domain-containing protein [Candidatus Nomurabacteria bacterium]
MMSSKKITLRRPSSVVVEYIKNAWWALLLSALLLVAIGLYALVLPGATINFFAALFGIVLVAAGAYSFIKSLLRRHRSASFGLVIGVITFIIGIYILLYPVIFVEFLVFIFAIILLVKSIFALQLSSTATGPSSAWLIVSGVLGVVAATFLFVSPAIGSLAILYVLGACAVLLGALIIADLISLRRN